jgi:proline iminopeptidase
MAAACEHVAMEPDPHRPWASGMLDVGDGHRIHWEQSGNPRGKPALVLHGGPGSGSSPAFRWMFDPVRYRVVQMDQRGCGRSTPHAGEPTADLSTNTTWHLVADCEALRTHLGIDRWLVWGGSWGSVLALTYAEAHPASVTELILVSVVDPSSRQVDWVTKSMGRIFPEAHDRFVALVPPARRTGDLAAAYAELLADPDPTVCEQAARGWCEWEDTHVATTSGHQHDTRYDDPRFRLCFARLVTHYWSHAAFLAEGQLLADVGTIGQIPGVVINGRLDISGPPDTAWQLAGAWPASELVLVDDAGHGAGNPSTFEAILAATERFASPGSPTS